MNTLADLRVLQPRPRINPITRAAIALLLFLPLVAAVLSGSQKPAPASRNQERQGGAPGRPVVAQGIFHVGEGEKTAPAVASASSEFATESNGCGVSESCLVMAPSAAPRLSRRR